MTAIEAGVVLVGLGVAWDMVRMLTSARNVKAVYARLDAALARVDAQEASIARLEGLQRTVLEVKNRVESIKPAQRRAVGWGGG